METPKSQTLSFLNRSHSCIQNREIMGRIKVGVACAMILFATSVSAQEYKHGIKLGTQIPLQYSLMYEFQPIERFSLNAGVGAIAPPYPTTILNIIGRLNVTSDRTNRLIEESYESGVAFEGGANYHFGKSYVRLFGQSLNLSGEVSYTDLAQIYSGINFNFNLNQGLELNSKLIQAGLLFGYRFEFPNIRHQIHLEGSISKTLSVKTKFESGTFLDRLGVVQTIYNQFDNDIDSFFKENSYVPTINIYYVYKF